MKKIGLISDTHGYLNAKVFEHFKNCDEIWHGGDFGSGEIIEQLQAFKPLKGVFGNIDGHGIRSVYPQKLVWNCEDVTVYMTHIGGHTKKYAPGIKQDLITHGAKLFISGHSHILKIVYDAEINCLHMNPGAAGNHGWHKITTLIRFTIDGSNIKDCEVIELGRRGTH